MDQVHRDPVGELTKLLDVLQFGHREPVLVADDSRRVVLAFDADVFHGRGEVVV